MEWFYGFLVGLFVAGVSTGLLVRFLVKPFFSWLYDHIKASEDLVEAIDALFDQLAEEWPPKEAKDEK